VSSSTIEVTFHPAGVTAQATAGVALSEAAASVGVAINAPCGGKGTCGKCRVRVRSGAVSEPTAQELQLLSSEELEAGVRLACQARALGECEVETAGVGDVVVRKDLDEDALRHYPLEPRVKRRALALDPPELGDQRSDLLRLWDKLGTAGCSCRARLAALERLPGVLRGDEFNVVATMLDDLLVAVEPRDTARDPYGAAVDVGTTTIVAYLVNLNTGRIEATCATLNPQTRHGADVISRIEHARDVPGGLEELQGEVVGAINALVGRALQDVGAETNHLFELTVVGNTAMHHLLLGLDPQYIAQAPYIPVVSQPLTLYASDLGIEAASGGQVFVLPIVAGFVGADTVGVMTAADITSRGPTLAVDIGTNGEIALWSGERLLCASAAAGPAFEGAKISQGMYAAPGAISAVTLNGEDLEISTIDGEPARGICGSALFDATAVLLETGALELNGRLAAEADGLPPGISARMSGEGNGRRVLLASEDIAHNGHPVYLTQPDIREIQLAKGAIRAGVEVLLAEAGISADDLEAVLLAGAFGNHIRPESAVRMGVLPPVDRERVVAVGNAAGAGALMALCSESERGLACRLAVEAEHVELAANPRFQMAFMETMLFE